MPGSDGVLMDKTDYVALPQGSRVWVLRSRNFGGLIK